MSGSGPGNIAPSLAGLPTDPEARDVLAAEHVLGTIDAAGAARVVVAVESDTAWRDAVAAWETRLASLVMLPRPESPPPNLWDRIAERIAPAEPMRVRQRRRFGLALMAWAIAATLIAAGSAGYAFYPRAQPPRVLAVLVNDRNLPGVLVELDRSGGLRMSTMTAVTGRQLQAPGGRAFHLWAVLPGGSAPMSIAVLPHEPGRQLTVPLPRIALGPDTVVEISLEPDGGSKTGAPTGPIIYIGRLSLVGADFDSAR